MGYGSEKTCQKVMPLRSKGYMGRIRTHDIKKLSFELIERYSGRFTTDFKINKEIVDELKLVDSKKMRNKIAGYVTRVAKRKAKINIL